MITVCGIKWFNMYMYWATITELLANNMLNKTSTLYLSFRYQFQCVSIVIGNTFFQQAFSAPINHIYCNVIVLFLDKLNNHFLESRVCFYVLIYEYIYCDSKALPL